MLNTYALIDGVMQKNAVADLYCKKEPLQVLPLYINTQYHDNYDLGPILVAALNGSSLMTELEQQWSNSTSLLQSKQPLNIVAQHLIQLLTVIDESRTQSLFRFADPLVTWYWLNSYHTNALVDIMGPIDIWKVAKPIPDWQDEPTSWHTFTKSATPPLGFQINNFGEPQEEALQLAADFRYQNKMYHWLQKQNPKILTDKTPNQISDWLQDTFTEAKNHHLISERAIAMWIDLCADYGQDFYTQPEGLYQQWLTDNPAQKKLPTEVKIKKFYEYINT